MAQGMGSPSTLLLYVPPLSHMQVDGKTYGNDCTAFCSNVAVASVGECPAALPHLSPSPAPSPCQLCVHMLRASMPFTQDECDKFAASMNAIFSGTNDTDPSDQLVTPFACTLITNTPAVYTNMVHVCALPADADRATTMIDLSINPTLGGDISSLFVQYGLACGTGDQVYPDSTCIKRVLPHYAPTNCPSTSRPN